MLLSTHHNPAADGTEAPLFHFLPAPYKIRSSWQIWSWSPDGARHLDRLIDWPSVATWLWLWISDSVCHLISRCYLYRHIRPWRWRRYSPPKLRLTFNGLHDVISQMIVLFITTAVRTSTHIHRICSKIDQVVLAPLVIYGPTWNRRALSKSFFEKHLKKESKFRRKTNFSSSWYMLLAFT
jgi:hypothetical protein